MPPVIRVFALIEVVFVFMKISGMNNIGGKDAYNAVRFIHTRTKQIRLYRLT